MGDFNSLFTPLRVNDIKLRNRFVMAPVPSGYVSKGHPQTGLVEFYQNHSHGPGLIIAGAINVDHETASNNANIPYIKTEEDLNIWKQAVKAVHNNGAKMFGQIWHSGGMSMGLTTPSGIINGKRVGDPMSYIDIQEVINSFVKTSERIKEAGFDGLEIQAAHGSLLHNFLFSSSNNRTDQYGLDNGFLFVKEVLNTCRQAVGMDYPIILRISDFRMDNRSEKIGDTPEKLKRFVDSVTSYVDGFDCSMLDYKVPEYPDKDWNLAKWIKKLSNKVTISTGKMASTVTFDNELASMVKQLTNNKKQIFSDYDKSIFTGNLELINNDIEGGSYDLASFGRPFLIDPDWVVHLERKGGNL